MTRFLIFTRADRHPWQLAELPQEGLSVAVSVADHAVDEGGSDRAVVMEISGTDAMPMFSYRYGAKR